MATAEVSQESLNLLQEYKIDVRDFTKASVRYVVVLEHELVIPEGEEHTPEVTEATRQARENLQKAWLEYIESAGKYFKTAVDSLVTEILALKDERDDIEVEPTSVPTVMVSAANVATTTTNTGASNIGGSFNRRGNPLAASQSSFMSHDSRVDSILRRPIAISAERHNELCNLCEKWLYKNERLFVLPRTMDLVGIVRDCVSSTSQLFRLLGLHLVSLCLGNKEFTQALLNDSKCILWIGMSADREIIPELEKFLDIAERLVDVLESGTIRYPYSWIYRVASLLHSRNPRPNVPPKRRSQAIRIAMLYLKRLHPQATAARIHILLMRACTAKNFVTPEEMFEILDCMLSLFNNPKTREYLQLTDISVLFEPLLDCAPATPTADYYACLNNAKDAIVYVLSTWVGNLWLAAETTSLRAMIDLIHLPGEKDRRMVVLTLFNKLLSNIAPHRGIIVRENWLGEEEERRRRELREVDQSISTGNNNSSLNFSMTGTDQNFIEKVDPTDATEDVVPTMKALGYHVMDPLLGTVLLNLLYQGLPLALVASVGSLNSSRFALEMTGALLQDVVVLMDSVLPRASVRGIHEAVNTSVGKLMASKDALGGDLTAKLFHVFKESQTEYGRDSSVEGTLWSQEMQSTQLYSSVGGSLDMDDRSFMNAIAETRVESSPTDWKQWRFDLLLVLVQGPLRNVNRLRKCTKMMRSLIAFYTPPLSSNKMFYMRQFGVLSPSETTQSMCHLCIEMTDLLLSTRDGATLLNVADLPKSLIAVLREVRQGTPKALSKDRVSAAVGQTLLRQIGRFTAHANGLILMREHGFFEEIDSLFVKLRGERALSPSPEDTLHEVCYQLLQYICVCAVPNFGVCDDLRHTFKVALTNESSSIRLCVAMQLRRALLRDLTSSLSWGIQALVLALQDSFLSVVECAFKLLLNICMSSTDALVCLINQKPVVLMESPIILANATKLKLDALLYCIVTIPAGFRFLLSYGWIDTEVQRWEKQESVRYVRNLMTLQSGKEIMDEDFLRNCSFRGLSSHSFTLSEVYGRRPHHSTVPIMTESAISGANFFPTHFAEVLCNSPEGCTEFSQSELWKRSISLLQEQQLPPDIIADDVLSDTSSGFSDEDSDIEDLNKHSRQDFRRRRTRGVTYGSGGNRGMNNTTNNNTNTLPNETYTNSLMMSVRGNSVLTKGAMAVDNGGGVDGARRGEEQPNYYPSHLNEKSAGQLAKEERASQRLIKRLKQGQLSAPTILSAARGYNRTSKAAYTMECTGEPQKLMEAIIVVSMACSTEAGFNQLALSVENLIDIITSVSRFASHLTLRMCAQIALCVMARSKAGRTYLKESGLFVLYNPNAYVSAEGIPYAVSFAHLRFDRTISLSRRTAKKNTAPSNAYSSYSGVDLQHIPKSLIQHVVSLANPVTREASKKSLYKMMKKNAMQFVDPNVVTLCLEVCGVYHLDHAERKFIADLLQKAQLRPQQLPGVSNKA